MTAPEFNVEFTDKQSVAIQSEATEILYGGAASGGKSYFIRAFAILLCMMIPGLNVYLFRRLHDDLIKNHMEGTGGFPEMLAHLIVSGHVRIVEAEIRFWNGSKIFLCHCQHEKDRFKYLGAEIHVLLMDELTTFTEVIYRFLRGRMRAPGLVIPQWAIDFFLEKFGVNLGGKIPLIICGTNPGNIGHVWVKNSFIDDCKPYEVRRMPKSEGGMLRQFIPAVLEDNPHVDAEDYDGKLQGLGNAELIKAMRYGDWNVVAGAFFDNIVERMHKLPTFTPPKEWTRFRSMDWGSAKPFSVGWWVIVDEDTWLSDLVKDLRGRPDQKIPRNSIIRYREWYGVKKTEDGKTMPNQGLRLSAEAVARGILERERGEKIHENMSPAGTDLFKEDGGPSFQERMIHCNGQGKTDGPRFKPADTNRQGGWGQMHSRLAWDGVDDGLPMLYVMDCCTDWWRTVPALQHDEHKVEDVDSDLEDHAGDDTRYACMARPVSRVHKPKTAGPKPWTMDWVVQNG